MTDCADLLLRHAIGRRAESRRIGQRCTTIGICGAQGSGKSTAVALVAAALETAGCTTAVLSLDDLYLGRAARAELAERVHPLFRTRGVPGTHDVALGIAVLDGLRGGRPLPLPRFDKAIDDPVPSEQWPLAPADVEIVLFEGWCVGVRPQAEAALVAPVNNLERFEDVDGRWRSAANAALSGLYQTLFAGCDSQVLLAAPGFDAVMDWRRQQEDALRATGRENALDRTMDDAQLARFIQHYERLTRHVLAAMPSRADLVIRLDHARNVIAVEQREGRLN